MPNLLPHRLSGLAEGRRFATLSGISAVLVMWVLWLLPPPAAAGAVVVYDGVTSVHTPVFLRVQTRSAWFPQGGRRISFFMDGDELGRGLSGADGYGYWKVTPRRRGLRRVQAASDGDRGHGLLLVLGRREQAVVIEIEGGLRLALLSQEVRDQSRRALQAIARRHPLIYLSRMMGTAVFRQWLAAGKFPLAPVMRWRGETVLQDLHDRGVRLRAFVGSSGLLPSALQYTRDAFTFEESDTGTPVSTWQEIVDELAPQ